MDKEHAATQKQVEEEKEKPNTIKVLDDRFYWHNEEWLPSVTTILGVYPKGPHLMKWVGEHGNDWSKRLKNIAAEKGSLIHNSIETLINGAVLGFRDYEEDEWRYLMAFQNFWDTYKPETEEVEHQIQSDVYKYAGTLDWAGYVTEKEEKKFVRIDWKTSNFLYTEYDIQLAAYEQAEVEANKPAADELWIVQLGTRTKAGYSLHKVKDREEKFEGFLLCNELWKYTNKTAKPYEKQYPLTIKL